MEQRIIEKSFPDGRSYHEDFYLDYPAYIRDNIFVNNIFRFWGVGIAQWAGKYSNTIQAGDLNLSLELITDGKFLLSNAEKKIVVQKGDIIILGLGTSWNMQAYPQGAKKCLFFSYSSVINAVFTDLLQGEHILHCTDFNSVDSSIDAIYHKAAAQDPGLGVEIFQFLSQLGRNTMQIKYPRMLEEILRRIENNPEADYSRARLAESAGISVCSLHRMFQKYLHCSPGEYVIQCRIAMARRMLSLHHMTVKEIAAACGYKSSIFFCREFKRKTGRTPGSFLQKKNHA